MEGADPVNEPIIARMCLKCAMSHDREQTDREIDMSITRAPGREGNPVVWLLLLCLSDDEGWMAP